jgi:hypothetical protein
VRLASSTLTPELRKKHDSIKAGKALKRQRFLIRFLLSPVPFVTFLYFALAYKTSLNVLILIPAFGLIPALLFLLFYGGKMLGKIIDPLNPVEKAFENLYKALDYDEPAEGEKYDPVVQEHIHKLMQSVSYQLSQPISSEILLGDEFGDLIEKTESSIDNRLVPAARDGRLTPEMMKKLANIIGKPSIDDLRKLNAEIEKDYEEGKEGVPISTRASQFFATKSGQIVQSLFFGFGLSFFSSAVYRFFIGQEFGTFFRDNPAVVLGGAFALTVGFLAFLSKK